MKLIPSTTDVFIDRDLTSIQYTVSIPHKTDKKKNEIDIYTLLAAYTVPLIEVLELRMKSCKNKLIQANEIDYSDAEGYIEYSINGEKGVFNASSFNAMKDAVKALSNHSWDEYLSNKLWINQTLKALFDAPLYMPRRVKEFTYNQLISVLCNAATN